MNSNDIKTASRIHPLMAGAAISVTLLSLVGAAAIAGLLPTSRGAIAPQDSSMTAPATLAPTALAAAPSLSQQQEPARAPVAHKAQHTHHATQMAQNDDRSYQQPERQAQQAAPQAAAQPNYVGIGAGAVIGGLLGNQVGGGRGKTLATIAGVVGGGMLGNEVQKQVQQPQR
ncbi:uncharacterized protein YcfJ [Oxalobacteraceae bacterium GrIS 1.11]